MTRLFLFVLFFIPLLMATPSTANKPDPKKPPIKQLVQPAGESLIVNDRPAFLLLPVESKRRSPQPWIMYAPTLPSYPNQVEQWMHQQFLDAGLAVTGIDAGEAYGSPAGQKLMTALYEQLVNERDFAKKPCLLGRSRGGLWVASWAIAHPNQVAGIAGIMPSLDLRSYPGIPKAAQAYEFTAEEFAANLARHNPIAQAAVLAKAKIPVLIIHGSNDNVVPLQENSAALAEIYKRAGVDDLMTLIVAKGQGHTAWKGFFRCQPLVDFAIKHAKTGAKVP